MEHPTQLRAKSHLCRELARSARDEATAANLLVLADEYEAEAGRLEEAKDGPSAHSRPE